jgi:carbonic anhydrase
MNSRFQMRLDRAAFLAGSFAAASAASPGRGFGAAPSPSSYSPEMLLGRLMAGNKRFVENDFPQANRVVDKRALVAEGQAPFAAVLSCSDSRVIPELVFVQGIGELFVTRVAGNYPDALVTGSLEYAIEHLGTTLIMVLGHQGCGAVKAVYSALETKSQLPSHLSAIQALIAPGIAQTVANRASQDAAIAANVRAAAAALRTSPPVIAARVAAGSVRVASGVYHLGTGEIKLLA